MTDKQRVSLIREARRELHESSGYKPNGLHYRRIDKILNLLEKDLSPPKVPRWAGIGPISPVGISLLDMSLTHNTDGIPLYPAVDANWGVGQTVLCPEFCIVGRDTHASPGEAVYLEGNSGMKYWVGHINKNWPPGTKISKGTILGKTVPQARPHGHWGVNGEAFLGKGKQFLYGSHGNGPDYTLGAPTIRTQLAASEQ